MGTRTIVKEIIVEKADPKIARMLEETRKELEEMKKRYKDPTKFSQNEEELFERFLKNVENCKFKSVNLKRESPRDRHIAFLGDISVGKSTIINALAGRKVCETGMGETTSEIQLVFQKEDYRFWDVPGNNKAHNYLDINNLSFLKALDKVFVLYNSSPKDAERLIRVADTLNVNFSCIRTCCDNIDDDDVKGVKETVKDDIVEIQGMLKKTRNMEVFAISARNVIRNNNELYDWSKLLEEIFRD